MPEMGWGVYGLGAGVAGAILAGLAAWALAGAFFAAGFLAGFLAEAFFAETFFAEAFFAARLTVFFFAMARNLHHVSVAGQRVVGSSRNTGWRGASATKAASGSSGRTSKYGRVMGTSVT
jgi:hypothetical protein